MTVLFDYLLENSRTACASWGLSALRHSYADFTIRHYGKATIVFYGYSEGPSIKDNTHQRRGQNTHPIVNFNAKTEFVGRKDEFLSRPCNKQGLIDLRNCRRMAAPLSMQQGMQTWTS